MHFSKRDLLLGIGAAAGLGASGAAAQQDYLHGKNLGAVPPAKAKPVPHRKVTTRNGERLEIRSMGQDQVIKLDALALEALTWSTPLEVGKGLETPLGPDPSQPSPTSDGSDR